MRIAIINDTHTGIRNSSEIFLDNAETFYSDVFFPYIDAHGIDTIIHLGDYYDHRKFINFRALNRNRTMFLNPLRERGLKMHLTLGNHDTYYKNTNELNSPKELLGHYMNEVIIHPDPEVLEFDGFKFGIVPWICAENQQQVLKFLNTCSADVIGGHFEFSGYDMIKGIVNEHGMDPSTVSRFEMVLSGHYHTKSSKGNITYLGSQMEFYWNDVDDPKYFHILDTDARQLEAIHNPNTLFEKIYYDDSKGDPLQADLSYVDNKFVKVIVINKTDAYTFDRFIDRLADRKLHDMKIAENFNEWIGENVDDENILLDDTSTILSSYIDAVETDLDRDKIKSQMHQLMIEAQTMEVL